MNIRSTTDLARHLTSSSVSGARHISSHNLRLAKYKATLPVHVPVPIVPLPPGVKPKPNTPKIKIKPRAPKQEHGRHIFIYNHLLSKRVLMSLSETLDNSASMRQLPFLGKKTVPAALRKDHWLPLATIEFPVGAEEVGLSSFQKLREYRRRHDLEWDPTDIKIGIDTKKGGEKKDGRGAKEGILPKRLWKWNLCDQKADTIADMAAVLGMIGTETGRSVGLAEMPAGLEGQRVLVKWNHVLDAEFAQTWSENVAHSEIVKKAGRRAWGWPKDATQTM